MKTITPTIFALLMTCLTIPAFGMDTGLTVMPYSNASATIQKDASDLMDREFSKNLSNPAEKVRVLLERDKLLGVIVYRNTISMKKPARSIEYLAIKKEYRDKGYGKHFMQWIEDDSKQAKIEIMMLDSNKEARNFYLKLGFKCYLSGHASMYKNL